jgi:hypothetical protein
MESIGIGGLESMDLYDADGWLAKAEEARTRASAMRDAMAKRGMAAVVATYERLGLSVGLLAASQRVLLKRTDQD